MTVRKEHGGMVLIFREVRRYLGQASFLFSTFLVLVCFLFEHRDYLNMLLAGELLFRQDVYYLFSEPFKYGLFFYLMPLIAIPPAALTAIEDLQSRSQRMRLHRSSKKRIVAQKLCALGLGSMLPALTGCLLFFLVALAIGPLQREPGSVLVTHGNALIDAMILRHHGLPYLGFLTGMTMLTALLWGLVGVCIALISLNKGKTLILGFLLFWGMDAVCLRLNLIAWRPFNLFFISPSFQGSLLAPLSKNLLLLAIAGSGAAALIARRNRQL